MNPIARLNGTRRLDPDEKQCAAIFPLIKLDALKEGRATNPVIDDLFIISLRLQIIGGINENANIISQGQRMAQILQSCCDLACDRDEMVIRPSTDQMKIIKKACFTLSNLADTLTRKTYFAAVLGADELFAQIKKVEK